MRARHGPAIEVKTAAQQAAMQEAGRVVARALQAAVATVAPGVATAELDGVAEREIRACGAAPSFLGYHGFPAATCVSVNEEIVHGIPGRRLLREGDVVSIDCGANVEGWHADAALTVGVGSISGELATLLETCEHALWRGLAQARPGARVSDISHAVQQCAREAGDYGIVEDYVGHGIGSMLHMDPPVPNYGRPGRGPVLGEGMALAVEPLLVLGQPDTDLLDDGWTVVSADGSWSAHFEHTVMITADGPRVLTALDGEAGAARRWDGRPQATGGPDVAGSAAGGPAAGG